MATTTAVEIQYDHIISELIYSMQATSDNCYPHCISDMMTLSTNRVAT